MTCSDHSCRCCADSDARDAVLVSSMLGVDLVRVRDLDEVSISRTGTGELLLRCRQVDASGAVLDLAVFGRSERVQEFVESGRVGIATRRLTVVTRSADGSALVADDRGTVSWLAPGEPDLPMWPTPDLLADIGVPDLGNDGRVFRVAVAHPPGIAGEDFATRWVIDPKVSDAVSTSDTSDHWVTGSRNTALQVVNGGKIRAAGVTIGSVTTTINSSDFTVSLASGTYANYAVWGDSPIWVDGVRRA